MGKKLVAWKYFTPFAAIEAKVKCKLCSAKISTKGDSTSGMLRHLAANHSKEAEKLGHVEWES